MRAAELGAFLRSRRARIDAVALGFPAERRRSSGLRREELASLAGVTVSWLAKLEQGHAHAVSRDVLAALARALRLDDAERGHLFGLAGFRHDAGPAGEGRVTGALRTLLDSFEPNPAYLLDRRWDIVAWNPAEEALFPGIAAGTATVPNLLELVFTDEDLARLMADHDEELVRLVSQFRLHADQWGDDPAIGQVVERLKGVSTRFAMLWDARNVAPFATTRRVFDHPKAGRLVFDHHRLAVLDQPGMQLVVYTPAEGTDISSLG